MITSATCGQLLRVVRTELGTNVTAAVTDGQARVALGMIDSVLQNVIARIDDEVRWMREEIGEIRRLAEDVISAGADPDGALRNGLAALDASTTTSADPATVTREYDQATAVLCMCVQLATATGGELRTQAADILQARLDRELKIRGEFSFARGT